MLICLICAMFFNLFMLVRIHKVGQERQRMLDLLYARLAKEINDMFENGTIKNLDYKAYTKEMYAEYDAITFDQMLWKFWKPVRSFYKC